MTLRRAILTKEGPPSGWARTNGGIEIRVEMGALLLVNPAMRQRFDQWSKLVFTPAEISVGQRALLVRNRQRQERTIGEERTGDAPSTRIKALAAEDNFHHRRHVYDTENKH